MDDNFYLCFTPKFPTDMAVKIFIKKYGTQPEKIFVENGLLRVGPEPMIKMPPTVRGTSGNVAE